MKKLKQNLSLLIFAVLLLLNWTAFGQTIKPISRTITPAGDTITTFTIQNERELVYQLQLGTNAFIELESLYRLDSTRREYTAELIDQNERYKLLVSETKNEANLCAEDNQRIRSQLTTSIKGAKKLRREKNILLVSTAVLSIATASLLLVR